MKSMKTIFIALFLGLSCQYSMANQYATSERHQASSSINWMTDYQAALQLSRDSSKPIVLFFTGSDWCGWCNKLEDEALNTREFAEMAKDQFIFVKLDFPQSSPLDPKTKAQNQRLKNQYSIQGYPTIIMIDGNEKVIGSTGYVAGGGRNYAEHLKQLKSRN